LQSKKQSSRSVCKAVSISRKRVSSVDLAKRGVSKDLQSKSS